MNVNDKLNLIRQQLRAAKALSGQAQTAFKKVEGGAENASSLLGNVSRDIFEAGLASQRRALKGAAERAEETLGEVQVQHGQVVEDLEHLQDIDPGLIEALANAKQEAEALGLPTNDTWFLRNAIDSAQREEDYASQSTREIDKSLWGIEGELGGALESAGDLSTSHWGGGWNHGRGWNHHDRGHHSRRRHHWGGNDRFRERLQNRIQERHNQARSIDEAAGKLDNPFDDIDRSADRGSRHQLDVSSYVDQALRWVDDLEMKFSRANQPPRQSMPVAPPVVYNPPVYNPPVVKQPLEVPSPTAPIPTLETPPQSPPSPPQPEPEGFFKRPWRG
jgi:hypothetical protein